MTALAFVNNFVSYSMLCADLEQREISRQETTLILGRQLAVDASQFRSVVNYPSAPISTGPGLFRLSGFYRSAARLVKSSISSPAFRYGYVVNLDNILTNYIVHEGSRPETEISVLVEGLMNYSDASENTLEPRRQVLKTIASRALGLRYVAPVGHVSGAFDSRVQRVVAFSREGLRAPEERTVIRPWPLSINQEAALDPQTALLVQTGLGTRMPAADYRHFVAALTAWIRQQDFCLLLTKRHPRFPDPYLESQLPPHEVVRDDRPLEVVHAELGAGVVVGSGTTPLATLKLMHPGLRCVDFGADYYTPRLYNGKSGPSALFEALGVECISLTGSAGA